METLNKFLDFNLLTVAEHKIRVFTLLTVLIIFVVTKIVLWIIRKTLFRKHKKAQIDVGNTYAIFQIIKYVIWTVAIIYMLDTVGLKVTVLLAGSAALLVGVGLGLQQTFNDFISGIILLSERTIRLNDILQLDGEIIKIQEIGLRTSLGLTRDEISIIIPNSLITSNKVINWSHQSMKTRFKIRVGVAYGSDVDLVIKVLEESAMEHPAIFDRQSVDARLVDFGNSSLDFELLFFSQNIFRIEKVKAEIRRIINRKFIENNITIPFPQVDVHFDRDNDKKQFS